MKWDVISTIQCYLARLTYPPYYKLLSRPTTVIFLRCLKDLFVRQKLTILETILGKHTYSFNYIIMIKTSLCIIMMEMTAE